MTIVHNPLMSMEGEQAVLAAMMLGPVEAQQITSLLTLDDFCDPTNKRVAQAGWGLIRQGLPVDPLTLVDHLKQEDIEIHVGIETYLRELIETLPVLGNWRAYVDIVLEKSALRKIVDACQEGLVSVRHGHKSSDITQKLVRTLSESLANPNDDLQGIEEVYKATMVDLQKRASDPDYLGGLSTGLRALDNRLNALAPGKLVAIAGRPAMGKSVLAQGISDYCAFRQNAVVMHYSMEMPADEICQRQLSSQCGIDNKRLRSANLFQREWDQLVDFGACAKNAQLFLSDVTNLRVEDVERQAVQLEQKLGRVDLIAVDYLQLMDWPGDDEVAGLGYLSREFKKLAGKLKCPIIIVCQLNRSCESRPDKRPLMSDLRGSGAIEQDCDVVLMCYRDEYYRKNTKSKGIAEVITRKFRQGDCGTDYLKFEGQHYRFIDLDDGYRPPSPQEDANTFSYQKATSGKRYRSNGS